MGKGVQCNFSNCSAKGDFAKILFGRNIENFRATKVKYMFGEIQNITRTSCEIFIFRQTNTKRRAKSAKSERKQFTAENLTDCQLNH